MMESSHVVKVRSFHCAQCLLPIERPEPLTNLAGCDCCVAFVLQWRRAVVFLQAALQRAGWPAPLPSQDALLQCAGRIAANSFSRYSDSSRGAGPASNGETPQQQCPQQQQQHLPQEHHEQQQTDRSGDSAPADEFAAGPQQQAAQGVQNQLQRLQLTQRRLWEGCAPQNGAAPCDSKPDEVVSIQPGAQQGIAAAAGHSPAKVEAGQQQTQQAAERDGGSGCAGAVQACGSASANASGTAHSQAVGRELFITASYFNHSCAVFPRPLRGDNLQTIPTD